jgi:hypothetical protein
MMSLASGSRLKLGMVVFLFLALVAVMQLVATSRMTVKSFEAFVGSGDHPQFFKTVNDKNNSTSIKTSTRSSGTPFQIVILTVDRFDYLDRLLESLLQSDYLNDPIDLTLQFDRPPTKKHNIENTKEQEWEERVQTAFNEIDWKFGIKRLRVADTNMGLRQAWLSAWIPKAKAVSWAEERAIILEDDITVSPAWYVWLKGAYDAYGDREDVAAFSLQRQQLVPLKSSSTKVIPAPTNGDPFLYALVGSIGYAPKAKVWRDFLEMTYCALHTDLDVSVEGLVTSDWYRPKEKQRGIWTQLWIYYTHNRNLYTVYSFPQNNKALAAHHQAKGVHFHGNGKQDFPLANVSEIALDRYPKDLKKLDWGAREVVHDPNNAAYRQNRTIILSAAIGYKESEYILMISGIRRHYQGHIALLVVNDISQQQQDYFDANNVIAVRSNYSSDDKLDKLSKEWYAMLLERWDFYKTVCREEAYDWCLAIDFRDTLFQDDPFRNIYRQETSPPKGSDELHVFHHNLLMNDYHLSGIAKCSLWKSRKNDRVPMDGSMIVNGGGLIGTPGVFSKLAESIPNSGCDDQISLNIVVYDASYYLPNVALHFHLSGDRGGPINNVAYDGVYTLDRQNRFLNDDCFPTPIVHQMDMEEVEEVVTNHKAAISNGDPSPVIKNRKIFPVRLDHKISITSSRTKLSKAEFDSKLFEHASSLQLVGTADTKFHVDTICFNKDKASLLVYGVGAGKDISWGASLIDYFRAEVHWFDPSRKRTPHVKRILRHYAKNYPKPLKKLYYTDEGLWNTTGDSPLYDNPDQRLSMIPVNTLKIWMEERQHTYLDILKIDVEGREYNILEAFIEADVLPFTQLIVDYHREVLSKTSEEHRHDELHQKLRKAGFAKLWSQNGAQQIGYLKLADLAYCEHPQLERNASGGTHPVSSS